MTNARLLLAAVVLGAVAGTAIAVPWFADNFDSYANQAAMEAVWLRDIDWYNSGSFQGAQNLLSPPNAYQAKKTPQVPRNWRSLVPGIQAIDPTKNAVNGTANDPLIVSFQMDLNNVGKQFQTALWLELVGREVGTHDDYLFSAPTHNPGTYGKNDGVCTAGTCAAGDPAKIGTACVYNRDCETAADVGVCDVGGTNTCTAGYYNNVGKACLRNLDCDTPMWLDYVPNPTPASPCYVQAQSLELGRPSLAFGVYGGQNGLVPKGDPDCAYLGSRGLATSVVYDGGRWSQLTSRYPAGSSVPGIAAVDLTTDVVLTIRDTDYDITVLQAVPCGYAGRCDNSLTATCVTALAGTCVSNVCTSNGAACTVDADCNFCSDDSSMHCTADGDCQTNVCVGGPNPGMACTTNPPCQPTNGTCDLTATCTIAPAGTCVGNVCSNNQAACTTDAECNSCSNNAAKVCAVDADCRNVCVGGTKAGSACTVTADCLASTCIGGSTDGAACSPASAGSSSSLACGRATYTKAHIPRKYTGPFQAIALGPGRIFEGLLNAGAPIYGSTYPGFIDTISISGGQLVTVTMGSCCLADGTCLDNIGESACTQITGATYSGDGVTCASARCATGACCTAQACVADKTQTECEGPGGLGGVFQGIHTTCQNRICCPRPFADADWDGDVDQDDFGAWQVCYTGTGGGVPAGCSCFNRNGDGGIDGTDFNKFSDCFTGANVPWVAGGLCVP